jgi:hypothetical protein
MKFQGTDLIIASSYSLFLQQQKKKKKQYNLSN